MVAKVDGELWDLDRPFEKDSSLQLLKFDDKDGINLVTILFKYIWIHWIGLNSRHDAYIHVWTLLKDGTCMSQRSLNNFNFGNSFTKYYSSVLKITIFCAYESGLNRACLELKVEFLFFRPVCFLALECSHPRRSDGEVVWGTSMLWAADRRGLLLWHVVWEVFHQFTKNICHSARNFIQHSMPLFLLQDFPFYKKNRIPS